MRGAAPGGARGAAPAQTAAGGRGRGQTGFQTLGVEQQADSATAAAQASTPENDAAAVQALLPPGFSPDTSGGDAIAITGNNASLDRGMMQDRFDAIGRGEFDPASGEFGAGLRAAGRRRPGTRRTAAAAAVRAVRADAAAQAGRAGAAVPADRGGPGGRGGDGGGFFLGGRGVPAESLQRHRQLHLRRLGARQRALPAAPRFGRRQESVHEEHLRRHHRRPGQNPRRLRRHAEDQLRPHVQRQSRQQPVRSAGHRADGGLARRRLLVDPGAAHRSGDARSRSPTTRFRRRGSAPRRRRCLNFIPLPNLDGSSQNYHRTDTVASSGDTISLRVTHNFTPAAAGGRGAGGRGGGGGGGAAGGGAGGRGGRGAQQGTSRQHDGAAAVPARRQRHPERHAGARRTFDRTPASRCRCRSTSATSGRCTRSTSTSRRPRRTRPIISPASQNVSALAGITGVSTDPFDWGVSSLSFSGFQSLRDVTPSRRTDRRLTAGYSWTLPYKTHQLRAGGDMMIDRTSSRSDPNANGAFVFTGLYSAANISGRVPGADFADFLLGLPQQAHAAVRARQRAAARPFGEPLLPGRLAQEREADAVARRPLRADLAVHRGQRPSGRTSTCRPTSPPPPSVLPGQTGPFTGSVPGRAAQDRREQRRAAARRGLPPEAGPDPARRLRHQLQLRLVLDDRAPAREPAAVRRRATRRRAPCSRRCPITNAFGASTANQMTNNYGVDQGLHARPRADVERRRLEGPRRRRGTSAAATRGRPAPASTWSARPTAGRSACASRTCRRSSGRPPRASRC